MQPPSLAPLVQGNYGIRAASRGHILHDIRPPSIRDSIPLYRPPTNGSQKKTQHWVSTNDTSLATFFSTVHITSQPTSFLRAWMIMQPHNNPSPDKEKKPENKRKKEKGKTQN
ncbi:hypothetical protein ABZX51_011512 [Aspergillus tubingensis]